MSECSQKRADNIRKFESRVLNRSCADFFIYDKLADSFLENFHSCFKPNSLSLASLVPLVLCSLFIQPGTWWSSLAIFIALLLHQIFDIANKKQAYRFCEFTLQTYYIDYLCDSISCLQIVDTVGRMLFLESQTRIICLFFFGILPFFIHHLATYTNGYLIFHTISPAVQDIGLLFLEIFFIFMIPFPNLPKQQLWQQLSISQIFLVISTIFLIIFLLDDLKIISKNKAIKSNTNSDTNSNNLHKSTTSATSSSATTEIIQTYPLKKLIVIGIFGYVIMEIAMIEIHLLCNTLYYTLLYILLSLVFSMIICELVLAYGYQQKFKQFSLNILGVFFAVVMLYTVVGLVDLENDVEVLIGQIVLGGLGLVQSIYFCLFNYRNLKFLHSVRCGNN